MADVSPQDINTLRKYVTQIGQGETPGPKAMQWMQETANALGLDFDTLTSGGQPGRSGALEGASFGFRDEIAGGLAALTPGGKGYTEARDKVRSQAAANEFLAPKKYLAGEIAGGTGAGLVPFVGWGGRAATLGKTAGWAKRAKDLATGAGGGAAYAYGQQEGDNNPFTKEVLAGGAGGGAGGLAGGAVGDLFGAAVRMFTGRSKKAQEAAGKETRRLMDLYGLTPEEVMAGLADGSLASQNKTLQAVARSAYNSASAEARKKALKATGAEAQQGRTHVLDNLMSKTPYEDVSEPAVRDAAAVPNVDAQYAAAYGAGNKKIAEGGINPAILGAVEKIATLHPPVVKLINQNAKAAWVRAGRDPARFKDVVEVKDGAFTWLRDPSMEELANINSSVRDAVSGMYNTPGAVPRELRSTLDDLQKGFRDDLGGEFPEWGNVQTSVANSKAITDGYAAGSKGVRSPNAANELLDTVKKLDPTDAADAARLEGIKASVIEKARQMLSAGPNANPMARGMIGDADTGLEPHMATILRELFPGEDLTKLLKKGAGAQDVYNALTTGSQTAELQALANKGGGDGLMSMAGNLIRGGVDGGLSAIGAGSRMLSKKLNIDEPTADMLLEVLTTTDPQIMERLMKGDPEAVGLAKRVLQGMRGGVGGSAGTQIGMQSGTGILPMLE